MMQLAGWAVATVSVIGTVVIYSNLSDQGYGDDVPSSVTWSAIIDGLVPMGIGLLIVAAGLIVRRLDQP